jgi:cobalt-zinc-cadmium efflux system outer membrane protein
MRNFNLSSAVLVSVLTLPLSLFAQQPFDLHTALNAADSANLELRAARQQRALALAGLTSARQFPNPTIGFTAARDTPHEGISVDLPVELGGKRSKRIAVSREEQKSTEIDLGTLAKQIRRRTREAFYHSLLARAQTQQSKTALDLAERIRNIVQQRYEVGDVAQLEVLQADVEVARSSTDFEITAEAQKSADVTLAALLNRQWGETLGLSGRMEEIPNAPELETITSQAMQSSSDLMKTAQDLNTEEKRLSLAKAQRIPNIDLSAGADFNSPPDFRVGPKGGIAVTVPLLYHGQGEVALSNARLELLRLTLASQRVNVSAQVASSYFDYIAKAHQAQQYREKIVPQTLQLVQMAEESYKAGKTNIVTLLDAQRRLNDLQKNYLDALLAAQSSFATLEESVGVPLD